MAKYSTSWYILAVGLLSLITNTHLTSHDSSHGYISSNERYFDDFSFIEREISSGLRSEYVGDNIKFQIKFDPATLDFRQRPLGVPHIKKVHLYNFDTNRSIDMTSISGSTVHFHSSFFHDKKIPPMGNTTFNVVFLGREEGSIESCLFIHTTNGHFKYNVKGISIYSPYYLRPIVDVKLPVNATFGPLLYLHNPHSEPIQIVEVYTSGGDFHLELPTGEREGPKNIWEIAPFETKAVIRVKFSAKIEQNHTAFVRIRLNITEEVLVVPLEVEVGPRGGIFSPQGYVDFGIGGSMDRPKQIKLCLYNPFTKPVKIQSITTESKSIRIQYEPLAVIPTGKTKGCGEIANLTLDWKKALKNKDFNGKIIVKYRNGKSSAEIPYFLTVLEGGLSYDAQTTKYFINDKSKSLFRHFKLKNEFKSTIKLLNLSLGEEVQKYFKVASFKPLVLKEQEERVIFTIDLKPGVKLADLQIHSHIEVKTNVSCVVIPVLSYKGTLKLYLPFKSKDYSLDVGLISFNTRKEINFLILNDNPVNIQIRGLKTSIPLTSTTIIGCGRTDPRLALLQHSFENLHRCSHLVPGEYAILKLIVQTANNEGHVWGEIQIETDYENLSIPVQFKVAAGKLEIGPDRLVFDQCFPGKICSHLLRVHSTFNEPMIIKNIISLPPDSRLSSRHSGHILAHTTKIVGHLYLNPSIGCGNECYTGLHKDVYDQWLKTLLLPKSVVNFDLNIFNTFYNRFLNVTSNGSRKWQNLTLCLDTSEVRSHIFNTRVKMSWPSLLQDVSDNKSLVTFPLTQLGNVSYRNITIKNPSSYNLIVQILLDQIYPNIELLYEGLPSTSLPTYFPSSNTDNFFFPQDEQAKQIQLFDKMNIKVHSSTMPLLLKPGENYTLSVGFHGDKMGEFSTLLFLRNNLTVLEILRLQGKSTEPVFRFGNRKPGATQPLLFEFTDKHVKECERDKHYRYQNPNIVVKRSFTARNIGDIPIFVRNFYINDAVCEGYGFKVMNCAPFVLPANGTKKIDIEFTSDFTLAKVVRSLVLETSCNFNVNYSLQATIPSYYISICSTMIPRPFWEWYLACISVTLLSLTLFVILSVAIFDAEKIKKHMIDIVLAGSPSVQPVLDLRLLGQLVREEVQNIKSESKTDSKCSSKNIQIGETYKMKPEVEKVPALIPTVGKAKKKLGKKNSNEMNEYVEAPKKVTEVCKHKSTNCVEKREKEEDKKSSHSNKENKKVINCKRLNRMLSDEEKAFTTTESSTNTDEILEAKENSQKCTKINYKKINKVENQITLTPAEDNSKEIKIAQNKLERKKSIKNTLKTKELADNKIQTNVRNENRKKQSKEHKDKVSLCRKSSLDKSYLKSGETHNSNQALAAPANTKVWTENRATFSDVVARNDNPSNSRMGNMLNKPTMYVEPYKQTSTTLGPIGSKPIDFWQMGDANPHSLQEQQNESINSYFSNIRNLETQNISPILGDNMQCAADWVNSQESEKAYQYNSQRESGANMISPMQDYNILDPWNHNLLNTNTYWSNNNVNSSINEVAVENGLNASSPPSLHNRQSSYLWGSSSVWQPWVPLDLPRTPTRTPPGFSAIQPNTVEEESPSQSQRTETYNPFTSSNIWTQQQNIWKYSKDP